MNRPQTKEKLSQALKKDVAGYVTKIQDELFNKKGIYASRGKISQCLNPNHENWDNDIIQCATALVDSLAEQEENIHAKVKSL